MLFFEDAGGQGESYMLKSRGVGFLFYLRQTSYFLLKGFIEGPVCIACYFMILHSLFDFLCFLINLLKPFVDFNERLVFFALPNAILAVIFVTLLVPLLV